MTQKIEAPRVASKLEDLAWFEAVVNKSEQILSVIPEEDKSQWYKKYETPTADR